MHIAHACRNLLKIARFSLSPSNLLQLFAHQPLNRQLGEQKNIADNFLSKQRFDLTQGVLGLLSALHMNTGGRQFFQVNQHLCALYQRLTPQNFLLQECYNSLGDLMDMLVLGNSASNFMVYCLMSTKFRKTLLKVDQLTILLLLKP